jgi:hypothetical protein
VIEYHDPQDDEQKGHHAWSREDQIWNYVTVGVILAILLGIGLFSYFTFPAS